MQTVGAMSGNGEDIVQNSRRSARGARLAQTTGLARTQQVAEIKGKDELASDQTGVRLHQQSSSPSKCKHLKSEFPATSFLKRTKSPRVPLKRPER